MALVAEIGVARDLGNGVVFLGCGFKIGDKERGFRFTRPKKITVRSNKIFHETRTDRRVEVKLIARKWAKRIRHPYVGKRLIDFETAVSAIICSVKGLETDWMTVQVWEAGKTEETKHRITRKRDREFPEHVIRRREYIYYTASFKSFSAARWGLLVWSFMFSQNLVFLVSRSDGLSNWEGMWMDCETTGSKESAKVCVQAAAPVFESAHPAKLEPQH